MIHIHVMHIYTYMINYYSSSTHNIGNRMKIMYLRSSGLRNSVFPFPWVNYIVLTIYIDPISFPIAPLGSTQLRLMVPEQHPFHSELHIPIFRLIFPS